MAPPIAVEQEGRLKTVEILLEEHLKDCAKKSTEVQWLTRLAFLLWLAYWAKTTLHIALPLP